MSLARALTTKIRNKQDATPANAAYLGRAASQRAPNAKPIKRSEISLPVSLISTTNMLSYDAPDIVDAPHVQTMGGQFVSSNASVGSSSVDGEDSDHSGSVHSSETDATSVDMSSPELSSDSFHQKGYFNTSAPATPALTNRSTMSSMEASPPRIPARVPSHSVKSHMLSHQLSVRRSSPTASPPIALRDSSDMFSHEAVNHPFGKELEQLNEAAEEFGHAVRNAEAHADMHIMKTRGLARYCANEYLDEISSIYSSTYENEQLTYQPMAWI